MNMIEKILDFPETKEMTKAAIQQSNNIKLNDDIIALCRANACGNYGRNWTCPPNLGELAELQVKISSFDNYLVIQNIFPLEDSFDIEGMEFAMKTHDDRIRSLAKRFEKEFPNVKYLLLGCGGCKACEKCAYPDPCIQPSEALASVEGMGINVPELVAGVGFDYINGVNTVSYVGLLLWQD